MSIHLNEEQLEFLHVTIEHARSLLDAVHAYDSEEYANLGVCLNVLQGQEVSDAREAYEEEYNG
ncbi:hypothetical protein ZZ1p0032 [Acinetobacter phage ZZ1]|jgi:hypothetical protein|uniref:Uncharacterized protein n=2 Tax=Caudoviricetes TaxID=2731619 RepID=I3WVS7_9CAUD|nr:hypothetical protein ZZ1p0032 [Acinetobacter phage ZZ1]AFL47597.1 hypothetical protein ZZ1p0032 [Acinetobacter phage ZZ1]